MHKHKVAIVVLAGSETHEGMGRVANAMEAVKEFKDAGDDVQLIFDGAGTEWIRELSKPDHRARPLYLAVRDKVTGACAYCAGAFGVVDAARAAETPLLSEYDGHPSFRKLVADGWQVITF